MLLCDSFFCNATATTEIYTLSLHDALPIYNRKFSGSPRCGVAVRNSKKRVILESSSPNLYLSVFVVLSPYRDRKSTRLNSSHEWISYAVFCLKKKKRKMSINNDKS